MTLDLRDRPAVTLGGAAAVVLVATALVVLLAIVPYPELPSVVEQPEPVITTQLAVIEYDREPCIAVVDGRGDRREVLCGPDAEGFGLVWIDERTLELRRHGFDLDLVHIDVETGSVTVVSSDPEEAGRPPEPRRGTSGSAENAVGDRAVTGGRDGRTTLEVRMLDGTTRELLSLDGPAGYRLHDPSWSADGAWILVEDSAGRVIVVSTGEDAVARIWIEGADEAAIR